MKISATNKTPTLNYTPDSFFDKNLSKELKDIKKSIADIELMQKQFGILLQQIANKLKYKE